MKVSGLLGRPKMGLRWLQDGYKSARMSEDVAKRFKRGEIESKVAPRCLIIGYESRICGQEGTFQKH